MIMAHVFPIDDIWPHLVREGSYDCECDPEVERHKNGYIVKHKAIDPAGITSWGSVTPDGWYA